MGITRVKTFQSKILRRLALCLTFRRQASESSSNEFSNLPLEILIEILLLLEWDDVLRVRKTCRRLCDASKERPVWLALFKWYSASVEPRPLWPQKPLDMYNTRELEGTILRWKSIKAGWARNDSLVANQRHFFISRKAFDCSHLLEGGRWLLVGTSFGSVMYFDLDAQDITGVTLVPTSFTESSRVEIRISIDMISDCEYLTFNLAILAHLRRPPVTSLEVQDPSCLIRMVQVWRVTMDVNLDGRVTGLIAQQLSSFQEEYSGRCASFGFRGNHVAYSFVYNGCSNITVVDWTQCHSMSLVYERKIIPIVKAKWLTMLPGNRLLCLSGNTFLLFDLADIPITTRAPSLSNSRRISAIFSLEMLVQHVSQTYFAHNSTRITFLTYDGLRGMIIPHPTRPGDPHSTPVCVDLVLGCSHSSSADVQLGYDRAVLMNTWCILTVMQFSWPEDPPCSIVSHKTVTRKEIVDCDPTVLFDTSSGRVVLSGNYSQKQYILELAPI